MGKDTDIDCFYDKIHDINVNDYFSFDKHN